MYVIDMFITRPYLKYCAVLHFAKATIHKKLDGRILCLLQACFSGPFHRGLSIHLSQPWRAPRADEIAELS